MFKEYIKSGNSIISTSIKELGKNSIQSISIYQFKCTILHGVLKKYFKSGLFRISINVSFTLSIKSNSII